MKRTSSDSVHAHAPTDGAGTRSIMAMQTGLGNKAAAYGYVRVTGRYISRVDPLAILCSLLLVPHLQRRMAPQTLVRSGCASHRHSRKLVKRPVPSPRYISRPSVKLTETTIEQLRGVFKSARRVVVLAGAGISVEAGGKLAIHANDGC